jgi:hypothetical protein
MTTTNNIHFSAKSLAMMTTFVLCACGGGGDDSGTTVVSEQAPRITRAQATHTTVDSVAAMQGAQGAAANVATTPWIPNVADTWQWQLTGTINTSYNASVYDVDLFDVPNNVISLLHSQGKHVVCYFSAGSGENWRPDYAKFLASDLGNALDGWAGERWVDTRSANVRNIMAARLDLAKSRGCDGVEPDNVDGYSNRPGFALSASTQLDYNRYLATQARARGLKVALKNDVDQLAALESSFDFAVNEQCHQFNECAGYSVFTSAHKPVFNAEYKTKWVTSASARTTMCASARAANLRTLVLPLDLNDKFHYSCD